MRRGWQQRNSRTTRRPMVVVRVVEVDEGFVLRTPPALRRVVLQLLPNGKGELFRTPPALRRVVLQLLPNGKGELFRTPPALQHVVLQLLPNGKGRTLPWTTGFTPRGTSTFALR